MQAKNLHTLNACIKKLQKILLAERSQWILWLPVFYAVGILIYLTLPIEPNPYPAIILSGILFIISFFYRKKTRIYYPLFILAFTASGFSGANLRAIYVKAPVLEKEIRGISIEGHIDEINTYKKGHRVLLSNIKAAEIPTNEIPKKIRLTVLTKINDAKPGDVIEVRASLSPPPPPVMPGGYNFAQNAYFKQIGAVGFSVSNFTKISSSQNLFQEKIEQIRNIIAQRLVNSVGGQQAEIAKALLMGDTGGIDDETMVAIRNSGLAHLLSISGLHMVIVCAIFFSISRILLTLYPPISLKYNIKKIAAVFAIIGSFFYLLISGNPVPALRSFIMSSMIFIAMIFDRNGTALRIVAISALYILITAPENIISPSFQMSYGAVIALISAFEWLTPKLNRISVERRIPKIFMSITGTIISSIVATIATAPFAIYHFSRNSPYGFFANILAIPVTSFEIMPFGMLAMFLMPFNLEWLVAWPLRAGIDFVIGVANYVAALPYAGSTIPAINDWQLLLICFGFMWLVIWKTKWRLLGFAFAFIAVIAAPFNKSPDIIINGDGTLFAVKDEKDQLIFSTNKIGRYARGIWSTKIGQEETESFAESESSLINCDITGCNYNNKNYRVSFINHPIALDKECSDSDIFINLTGIKYNCVLAKKQINLYNLKIDGAHEIFLGKKITIKTVSGGHKRLWD